MEIFTRQAAMELFVLKAEEAPLTPSLSAWAATLASWLPLLRPSLIEARFTGGLRTFWTWSGAAMTSSSRLGSRQRMWCGSGNKGS